MIPRDIGIGIGAGIAGAPTISLLIGLVFEWSIPAVLRIEGLSRWGLNDDAAIVVFGWAFRSVSASRAVKNPMGGSCVDEELEEFKVCG